MSKVVDLQCWRAWIGREMTTTNIIDLDGQLSFRYVPWASLLPEHLLPSFGAMWGIQREVLGRIFSRSNYP